MSLSDRESKFLRDREKESSGDERRVSFSLPRDIKRKDKISSLKKNSDHEETHAEGLKQDSESDHSDTIDGRGTPEPAVIPKHKKKWKIKLPWKKSKKKYNIQSAMEHPIDEEESAPEEGEKTNKQVDSNTESETEKRVTVNDRKKANRFFSWYGESFKINTDAENPRIESSPDVLGIPRSQSAELIEYSDDSLPSSDTLKHWSIHRSGKHGVNKQHSRYSDSSSADDETFTKKNIRVSKKKKINPWKNQPLQEGASKSQPDLFESESKSKADKMKFNKHLSETASLKKINLSDPDEPESINKEEEKDIKKTNSLPSFFIKKKKNKKKGKEKLEDKSCGANSDVVKVDDNIHDSPVVPRKDEYKNNLEDIAIPSTSKVDEEVVDVKKKRPDSSNSSRRRKSKNPQKSQATSLNFVEAIVQINKPAESKDIDKQKEPIKLPKQESLPERKTSEEKESVMINSNNEIHSTICYPAQRDNASEKTGDFSSFKKLSESGKFSDLSSYKRLSKPSRKMDTKSSSAEILNPRKSSKGFSKKSEVRVRRRSYEEMLNLLEEEMFDYELLTEDESSDTDGDEVDISFCKLADDALGNPVKEPTFKLRSVDSFSSPNCKTELVFEPKIKKREIPLIPELGDKKSPTLKRPSYAPPPPPNLKEDFGYGTENKDTEFISNSNDYNIRTLPQENLDEKAKTGKSENRPRKSSASSSSLSSLDEIKDGIYANVPSTKLTNMKQYPRYRNEADEMNQHSSLQGAYESDSPPPFTPPSAPEGKKIDSSQFLERKDFATDVNNELPSRTALDKNIKIQSATLAAADLYTRKEERKPSINAYEDKYLTNLPIKNIKSFAGLKGREFNPPPPPVLPPPVGNPFEKQNTRSLPYIAKNFPPKYSYSSNIHPIDVSSSTSNFPAKGSSFMSSVTPEAGGLKNYDESSSNNKDEILPTRSTVHASTKENTTVYKDVNWNKGYAIYNSEPIYQNESTPPDHLNYKRYDDMQMSFYKTNYDNVYKEQTARADDSLNMQYSRLNDRTHHYHQSNREHSEGLDNNGSESVGYVETYYHNEVGVPLSNNGTCLPQRDDYETHKQPTAYYEKHDDQPAKHYNIADEKLESGVYNVRNAEKPYNYSALNETSSSSSLQDTLKENIREPSEPSMEKTSASYAYSTLPSNSETSKMTKKQIVTFHLPTKRALDESSDRKNDLTITYEDLQDENRPFQNASQDHKYNPNLYHTFPKTEYKSSLGNSRYHDMPVSSPLVQRQVLTMKQEALSLSYGQKSTTDYDMSTTHHKEQIDVLQDTKLNNVQRVGNFATNENANKDYIKMTTPIPYSNTPRPPLKSILRNSNRNFESETREETYPNLVQANIKYIEPQSGGHSNLYRQDLFSKHSTDQNSYQSSHTNQLNTSNYNAAYIERIKLADESSSDSESAPLPPTYPPPPPRPISGNQQQFLGSLLHSTDDSSSFQRLSQPAYLGYKSSQYVPTVIEVSGSGNEPESVYQNVIHASQV